MSLYARGSVGLVVLGCTLACSGSVREDAFDAYCVEMDKVMTVDGYDAQTEAFRALQAVWSPSTPADVAAFGARYRHAELFLQTRNPTSLGMRTRLFEAAAHEAGKSSWSCSPHRAYWARDLDEALLTRACDKGSAEACENLDHLRSVLEACARGDLKCPPSEGW